MNDILRKYQKALPYILALISVIIWGFNFVAAKIAVSGIPPFLMLSLRFLIVFVLLIPFYPKPPIPIKQIIIISFTFGLGHLGLMFLSLNMGLSSSVAIVVDKVAVPFSILFAYLFFKEKPTIKEIIGIIIAMIGTFFLAQTPNSIGNPIAFSLIIMSGFFWALYSVELKKFNSKSALALVAWISLFSFFITLTLSIIFEENQLQMINNSTISNWLALLYTAIFASIIAHGIWGYLMTTQNINKIIPMVLLVPVFGVFGGIVLLGEAISQSMIIGSLLMFLGLKITLIKWRNDKIKD